MFVHIMDACEYHKASMYNPAPDSVGLGEYSARVCAIREQLGSYFARG